MDIPNDLNKLLAQLKQVTRDTSRMSGTWASSGASPGLRPTAAEVEIFLRQHDFEPDAAIEQIEISNDGVFECYMFFVSSHGGDALSLLAMRPDQNLPPDAGEPF